MKLTLATFNIRNINDRYKERKPLLAAGFASLNADIVGLQEVVFSEPRQDDFLSAQVPGRHYRSFDARMENFPMGGCATLVAVGEVVSHEELRLSTGRVALRVLVALPGQRMLWFANTHLHHVPADAGVREEQARAILAWMADAPAANATVVVGDFNAPPFEPAYEAMLDGGFASAFYEVHDDEPAVTWPSGIQAETMDMDGDPNCLDYIWVRGEIGVLTARVACNQPAPGDSTLYPSDHFALVAEVEV
ncbi:MAG: endonuclease/exonuclease/phosphatase family protein [Tepidiformaceae bacterium]